MVYVITLIPALAHMCEMDGDGDGVVGCVGMKGKEQGDGEGKVKGEAVREVGYILHPDVWGHGFATEALEGFMQWVFGGENGIGGEVEVLEAVTGVGEEGRGSQGVLRKCGFARVGVEEMEEEGGGMGKVERWRWDRKGGKGKG